MAPTAFITSTSDYRTMVLISIPTTAYRLQTNDHIVISPDDFSKSFLWLSSFAKDGSSCGHQTKANQVPSGHQNSRDEYNEDSPGLHNLVRSQYNFVFSQTRTNF